MDARLERLRAIVEQLTAERDQLIEDRDRLIDEAKGLMRERDHARTCAEEMRDLYAAEIDESIAAFSFSWEDDHGADCDGE